MRGSCGGGVHGGADFGAVVRGTLDVDDERAAASFGGDGIPGDHGDGDAGGGGGGGGAGASGGVADVAAAGGLPGDCDPGVWRDIGGAGAEHGVSGATGLSLTSMRGEWAADKPDMDAPIVQVVQNYMDNTTYYVGTFAVFAVAAPTIYIVHNIKYATSAGAAGVAGERDCGGIGGGADDAVQGGGVCDGGGVAGLAGGLLAHYKSLVNPESFRFMRSIEIVAMVILGGQGSITGSVLAAVGLTLFAGVFEIACSAEHHVGEHHREMADGDLFAVHYSGDAVSAAGAVWAV